MTDERLVSAARGGDATAFDALLRRHQPRLLRACGREPARVRISRLAEGTFYAELELDDGATVDARPSDALTLAVQRARRGLTPLCSGMKRGIQPPSYSATRRR